VVPSPLGPFDGIDREASGLPEELKEYSSQSSAYCSSDTLDMPVKPSFPLGLLATPSLSLPAFALMPTPVPEFSLSPSVHWRLSVSLSRLPKAEAPLAALPASSSGPGPTAGRGKVFWLTPPFDDVSLGEASCLLPGVASRALLVAGCWDASPDTES